MENKTIHNERQNLGYNIDELVSIGDHLHNCTTAIVIADVTDGKTHNTMASATGSRNSLIAMLVVIMQQNSEIEDIVTEAIAKKKMYDIAKMIGKINNNED
jgi:hypothetical protein